MKAVAGLLMVMACCFAASTYEYTVGSYTTSVTITQGQHGFSSTRLAVDVHDENGVKLATGDYSFSINGSTYAVSVSIPGGLSTGAKIRLRGPFAGSNTTASTDFKLEQGSGKLTVCASCSESAYAQRGYNSRVYLMEQPSEFVYSLAPVVQTSVRAYIQDNMLVFGVSGPSSNWVAWSTGPHTRIEWNVSAYPNGVIQLGQGVWNPGYWSGIYDNRPTEFQ